MKIHIGRPDVIEKTKTRGARQWFPVCLLGLLLVLSACGDQELSDPESDTKEAYDSAASSVVSSIVTSEASIEEGANLQTEDGFSIEIPPDVISTDAIVTVESVVTSDVIDAPKSTDIDGAISVGKSYFIEIEGAELNGQVLLTFPYNEESIPGSSSEADIVVGYYSDQLEQWVMLSSWVDTDTKTVSTLTDHLSWYNPFSWFSDNLPPTITDLRFDPVTYSVDCYAFVEDPESWSAAHPNKILLTVDDPDGIDDIDGPPMVTIRRDYALAHDIEIDPIPMVEVGPGQFELEWNLGLGQYKLIPIYESIIGDCGNLRTFIATVRVKDEDGNVTEQSTSQDVRYEPVPEIFIQSPKSNAHTSATPSLEWSLGDPGQALGEYENTRLILSSDGALKKKLIDEELPLTQQEYTVAAENALDDGKTYYWQIQVEKSYQSLGESWRFVRSQTASFVVDRTFAESEPDEPVETIPLNAELSIDGTQITRSEVLGDGIYHWLKLEIYRDEELTLSMKADVFLTVDLADSLGANYLAGEYTIWLEAVVNDSSSSTGRSSRQISNEVTMIVEPLFAELTVDGTRITRSDVAGDEHYHSLSWEVFRDGEQVARQPADNQTVLDLEDELGSQLASGDYTVWLGASYTNSLWKRISNEVVVPIKEETQELSDSSFADKIVPDFFARYECVETEINSISVDQALIQPGSLITASCSPEFGSVFYELRLTGTSEDGDSEFQRIHDTGRTSMYSVGNEDPIPWTAEWVRLDEKSIPIEGGTNESGWATIFISQAQLVLSDSEVIIITGQSIDTLVYEADRQAIYTRDAESGFATNSHIKHYYDKETGLLLRSETMGTIVDCTNCTPDLFGYIFPYSSVYELVETNQPLAVQ